MATKKTGPAGVAHEPQTTGWKATGGNTTQKTLTIDEDLTASTVNDGLVTNGDSHDHVSGDGAAITEAALSLSDNTTADVSTSKHGLCPKAPNDTAKFLRGDGTWAAAGGSNWTDGGTYLKPATDGDTIRAYDSGGTEYGELQHDTLKLAPRSSAPSTDSNRGQIYMIATPGYTADIASTSYAISGGDLIPPTGSAVNAFDNDGGTNWLSSQQGADVNGAAYIGQDFGTGNEKHIRRITIDQTYPSDNEVTSILFQSSTDGSSWTTIETIAPTTGTDPQTFDIPESSAKRYWRLLANSNTRDYPSVSSWALAEVEMMELSYTYALKWKDPNGNETTL